MKITNKFLKIAGSLLACICLLVVGGIILLHGSAKADFNANETIDDVVFNNTNTMSVGQIDSFLNSFPNSCISSNNGFSTPDPTGWSSSVSSNHGYTFGGNVTAGQAIYDAAKIYDVNPEVILATMQKEQSIVTGSGSVSSFCHYNNLSPGNACDQSVYNTIGGCVFIGMSYACPGGCTASYSGFSLQVIASSWLFRFAEERAEGITSGYPGYDPGDSSIGYGGATIDTPYTLSGGNTVTVLNGATASLYYYTPTLAGSEDFDTIFQDWFGPTTMADSYFAVVCDPDGSNAWYLLTSTGKYYISGTAYSEWGLSSYYPEPGCGNAANTVSQSFFDSLPTGPNLGNLLKDRYGNYFFIDNGEVHYVPNSGYLSLWGINPNSAVQSTGLVYAMAGGNWVGRFMEDETTSQMYLMDGGVAHTISDGMLYDWGYTPSQLTQVSDTYIQSLTQGSPITQFVTSSGVDEIVDAGRILSLANSDIQNAYGSQTYQSITSPLTLSFLPWVNGSQFVEDASTGKWYMVEGGNVHYIPNISIAEDWGYQAGQPLLSVTDGLINSLNNSSTLTYLVETAGNNYWIVDGQRHLLPTANVQNAWIASGTTVPVYSSDSIALLGQGADMTTLINPAGSPFVYTMDNGSKRYLPQQTEVNAYAGPSTTIPSLSPNLINQIPELYQANYVVSYNNNYYLLMNGTLYPINSTYNSTWETNYATPLSASTLARFPISSQTIGAYLYIGGTYYIMNDQTLVPVVSHLDAYGLNNSNSVSLPYNYWPVTSDASYLVSPSGSNSMYLITGGQKIAFSSFAQEANYGYVSQGVPVTTLDSSVVSSIPTSSSTPSLLVNANNAGVKLLSFGYALGFPNGSTLTNYASVTNPILTLSTSVYNSFQLRRTTSIIIEDDSGNDYVMQSGQKDLIQNPSLLTTTYAGIPITYLEGTTMASIPSGSPVN